MLSVAIEFVGTSLHSTAIGSGTEVLARVLAEPISSIRPSRFTRAETSNFRNHVLGFLTLRCVKKLGAAAHSDRRFSRGGDHRSARGNIPKRDYRTGATGGAESCAIAARREFGLRQSPPSRISTKNFFFLRNMKRQLHQALRVAAISILLFTDRSIQTYNGRNKKLGSPWGIVGVVLTLSRWLAENSIDFPPINSLPQSIASPARFK